MLADLVEVESIISQILSHLSSHQLFSLDLTCTKFRRPPATPLTCRVHSTGSESGPWQAALDEFRQRNGYGALTVTEEAAWRAVKQKPWMGVAVGRAGINWKSSLHAAEQHFCLCLDGMGVPQSLLDHLGGSNTPLEPLQMACCRPLLSGKSIVVGPIEDSRLFFAGSPPKAYGVWLLSKIDPTLPHTQAIVLVHTRKQAMTVESQLQRLVAGAGVNVRSISHCFTQTGPEAAADRAAIMAGQGELSLLASVCLMQFVGPHIVIGPPYSAFNTAEQAPAWRDASRRQLRGLVIDHFDEIAHDEEMYGFCSEVGGLIAAWQDLICSSI